MKFLAHCFFILLLVSCGNIYENLGSKDSVEATLYRAQRFLAEGEWTKAIQEFEKLTEETLLIPSVTVEYASAYSGRCGLDFLNMASEIHNIGSKKIFGFLLKTFPASSIDKFDDCKQAEDILKLISDSDGVAPNEKSQYLMAFNSLAKIGVILSYYADSNGDGTVDAGWDPCGGTGALDLPPSDINEIGTGLTLFMANVSGLSGIDNIFSGLETICTALGPVGFCSLVDVSDFTDLHRRGIRGVVRDDTDGIGLGINTGQGVLGSVCEP